MEINVKDVKCKCGKPSYVFLDFPVGAVCKKCFWEHKKIKHYALSVKDEVKE